MELVGYEDDEAGRSLRLQSWEVHSISAWKKLYNDLIDFCVWKLFNSDGYDEISRLILKHLEKCSNYQNAGIVIVALYDAYNEYLERHPRYMDPLA